MVKVSFFASFAAAIVIRTGDAFQVSFAVVHQRVAPVRPVFSTKEDVSAQQSSLDEKLDWIAHHLRLQCYDQDSGVYGLESKDRLYGIETIRVALPIAPTLGIELVEVAHGLQDARGLVLVSDVLGHAKDRIEPGDTIIGVFAGQDFKESTTACDYDTTIETIQKAKDYAMQAGLDTLDLELNRLVKRTTVTVIIEQDWRDGQEDIPETTELEALAGDNLRLLLMHHHQKLYDPRTVRLDTLGTGDCGGEGICGTCLVEVLEGGEHLNSMTPKESEGEWIFSDAKSRIRCIRVSKNVAHNHLILIVFAVFY
jgi:2Fe-2S iron-sulfur cluster binding domain